MLAVYRTGKELNVDAIRHLTPKFSFGISTQNINYSSRKESKNSPDFRATPLIARGGESTRGGASTLAVSTGKTMTAGQFKTFNLLSGGVAGTIASCLTNPLEVIRTQLQSSSVSKAQHGSLSSSSGHPYAIAQRILNTDGVPGFFKGLKPTLIGIIPARSIYFYSYEQTKRELGKRGWLPEGSVGNAIISGFAAGVASNTLTNPIWMVKTRMQLLGE
jgi:hypothetical protein